MDAFLIVQRGEDIGRRFDLDNNQLTIGRGSDNDLVLNDPMVSRYHAVLKQQGNRYSLIDLGSSNPVVINDQPLEPGTPQQLTHRDVVFIGKTVFSFQNRAAGISHAASAQPEKHEATQVISNRDHDPSTPLPASRSSATSSNTPAASRATAPMGQQEAGSTKPAVVSPPERPAQEAATQIIEPADKGAKEEDNDKTLIGSGATSAPPPPVFAPPPPPTAVKFDDEETNASIKMPPPPPFGTPSTLGDKQPNTADNDEDGDLPTQIIPRR